MVAIVTGYIIYIYIYIYTVRRKMFAINNFREFREWSTFANIIIREPLCSQIHGIYNLYTCVRTIITTVVSH